MLLVDASVLLYAVNSDSEHHDAARGWLDRALVGTEGVGFAWTVLLAFLRLATHPSVFRRPLTAAEAFDSVDAWTAQPAAMLVDPTVRHAGILRGLVAQAGSGGNLVNDAHLAALTTEHAATLVTFDRDFGRFTGVRSMVPSV